MPRPLWKLTVTHSKAQLVDRINLLTDLVERQEKIITILILHHPKVREEIVNDGV